MASSPGTGVSSLQPADLGESVENTSRSHASESRGRHRSLISRIVDWEDKWARIEKEHTGELPVLWKMAALMDLRAAEVENMVYQSIDGVNEDYEEMKQRAVSWVSNKVAQASGPSPTDIGEVYDGYGYDGEYEEEIAAVGSHA
jgi:hypothetical protein